MASRATRYRVLPGALLFCVVAPAHAAGTAFTYQGLLEVAGAPAQSYDFQAELFDAPCSVAPCTGATLGATPSVPGVVLQSGRFTLPLDFGAVFTGAERYLELRVKRSGEAAYTTLLPRQRLAATPYSQHAERAAVADTVPAGSVATDRLASAAVTVDKIDVASVQARVSGECTAPEAIAAIAADGTVSCRAPSDGPIDAADIVSGNLDPARLPLGGTWGILSPLAIQDAAYPETQFGFQGVGNVLFRGANEPLAASSLPMEGGGTRLMWYPQRAALRAGYLLEEDNPNTDSTPLPEPPVHWDHANIGNGSVALGVNVRASGVASTAFGYWAHATGATTFAAGEGLVANGATSVALGYHAHTNLKQGAFVFGDRSTVDILRAGVHNSANWRLNGGFRVFTSSDLSTGVTIQSGALTSNWGQANAVISTSTGAWLSTGGTWTNASDVARKHRFESVDGEDILARLGALPISTWSYRAEDTAVRHLGPTAQDFRAAFALGSDPKSIATVDADGVALVAAQALEARSARQQQQIRALQQENTSLRSTLAALEARLSRLESRRAERTE
jgi:hypothetical protein